MSKPRVLIPNNPYSMRVNKDVATEIGLNESIVFLQLEFLISTSTTEERDGRSWTYQSLSDLRENHFPWWSKMTIKRAIDKLVEMKLIIVGNYNKYKYDRTQWYSLNYEEIAKLKSVRIDGYVTSMYQNDTPISQNDTRFEQNDTTIPDTTTDTTTEKESLNTYSVFLTSWKEKFPTKTQPQDKTTKLKKAWETRIKDKDFQDGWKEALHNASLSPYLQNKSWFQAEYFLRNDLNWQKVKNWEFDWADEQKFGYKGSDKAKEAGSEIDVDSMTEQEREEYEAWRQDIIRQREERKK